MAAADEVIDYRLSASDGADACVDDEDDDDDEERVPCRNLRPSSAENADAVADDRAPSSTDPCSAFSRSEEVVNDEDEIASDRTAVLQRRVVAVMDDLWMSGRVDQLDVPSSFHSDPLRDEVASFYTCGGGVEGDFLDDAD